MVCYQLFIMKSQWLTVHIIIESNNAIADYQPLQLSDKTLPI